MTNKEAIEHLRELKTLRIEFPNTLQENALDIAIKALEETQACFYCKYFEKEVYEEPCNKCKYSYDNKFEWDISKYPRGDNK